MFFQIIYVVLQNSSHEVLVRSFQLAFSLQNISLNNGGELWQIYSLNMTLSDLYMVILHLLLILIKAEEIPWFSHKSIY